MLYVKNAAGTILSLPHDHPTFGKLTETRYSRFPQTLTVTLHPVLPSFISIPWQDIVQVSMDNVIWWAVDPLQTVIDEPHELPDDIGVDMTVHMAIGANGHTAQTVSAVTWGLAMVSGVHQHGVLVGRAGIVYLGPSCYFSCLQSLAGIGNLALGFTRAAAKTVNAVTYPANTPIFGIAGLLVSDTTSQDVPTILMPVATVRTVAARLTVYGAPTGTITVWTATKNKLTIDLTNSLLKWTAGGTTVYCEFPTTAYLAGTAVTIVVMENATTHVVVIACQAAGGSWYSDAGTLTISWANVLTIGNLKGWIAHLTQWPYVLTSAEYEAIHWPLGPLTWNGLTIALKNTGTLTLDESGVLRDAALNDISGLVAGRITLPAGGTAVDVEMKEGLSSRWTATARDTSI